MLTAGGPQAGQHGGDFGHQCLAGVDSVLRADPRASPNAAGKITGCVAAVNPADVSPWPETAISPREVPAAYWPCIASSTGGRMIAVQRVPFRPASQLASLIVLACALPLGAQVTQNPVTRPRAALVPPQAPKGDLVIERVTLDLHGIGATLFIKNVGTERVDIPVGSIVARGEPAQPGGWDFIQLADPRGDGFVLLPGSSYSLHLVGAENWCPAGKPMAVTFRVNPDNTLAEGNKANNGFAMPASSIVGDIASPQVWLQSERFPTDMGGQVTPVDRNVLHRGTAADLVVAFHNPGPGYVFGCQVGAPIVKDVQSPLAAFFGLRTYNYLNNYRVMAYPGGDFVFRSIGAVPPVPLAKGTYTWQFLLNPQGVIAESNAANNLVTITVTVIDPPPAGS